MKERYRMAECSTKTATFAHWLWLIMQKVIYCLMNECLAALPVFFSLHIFPDFNPQMNSNWNLTANSAPSRMGPTDRANWWDNEWPCEYHSHLGPALRWSIVTAQIRQLLAFFAPSGPRNNCASERGGKIFQSTPIRGLCLASFRNCPALSLSTLGIGYNIAWFHQFCLPTKASL